MSVWQDKAKSWFQTEKVFSILCRILFTMYRSNHWIFCKPQDIWVFIIKETSSSSMHWCVTLPALVSSQNDKNVLIFFTKHLTNLSCFPVGMFVRIENWLSQCQFQFCGCQWCMIQCLFFFVVLVEKIFWFKKLQYDWQQYVH